jgi:hypothetical protein
LTKGASPLITFEAALQDIENDIEFNALLEGGA